jgi:hypothetical protein
MLNRRTFISESIKFGVGALAFSSLARSYALHEKKEKYWAVIAGGLWHRPSPGKGWKSVSVSNRDWIIPTPFISNASTFSISFGNPTDCSITMLNNALQTVGQHPKSLIQFPRILNVHTVEDLHLLPSIPLGTFADETISFNPLTQVYVFNGTEMGHTSYNDYVQQEEKLIFQLNKLNNEIDRAGGCLGIICLHGRKPSDSFEAIHHSSPDCFQEGYILFPRS